MKKGGSLQRDVSTLIDVAMPREASLIFAHVRYAIRLSVVVEGKEEQSVGKRVAAYTIGISSTRLIRVRSRRRYPWRSTYTLGPDAYICDAAA